MSRIEAIIKKLENLNDDKIELFPSERKTIKTALRMWEAIDNVLDEEIGLNKNEDIMQSVEYIMRQSLGR